MSYKAEVIADSSGKWVGNALRFATAAEAKAYASDLCFRWLAVRDTRVVEVNDLVNYVWANDRADPLKEPANYVWVDGHPLVPETKP